MHGMWVKLLYSEVSFSSYLEMGDCWQLDKFSGKLPNFTAGYISLPVSSGEDYLVTHYIRI